MSGKYLLDTNIAIGLLEGEQSIKDHIDEADLVFVSSTILGEIYFGALKSSKREKNLARIQALISDIEVLECTGNTAVEYATIRLALQQIGRPLPENDIWIAAIAKEHHLVLATRDSHFTVISGLLYENW
jgi:tRNA(fMet)-specific endonuclease VapC